MLVNQSKETDYNTKNSEIEKKITTENDREKYITPQDLIRYQQNILLQDQHK